MRKKVVFDTSCLLAACIYPDRLPATIFKQSILKYTLLASPQTQVELQNVLQRPKFDRWQTLENRLAWLDFYTHVVELHNPSQHFISCIDPKDNMFLDLAVAGNASAIVSSDDHLLDMQPFTEHGGYIDILTLRQFQTNNLL